MAEPSRSLTVEPAEAGHRLDVFLASRLALSRAQARRLLARGAVRIAARTLDESAKGERVAPGTTVLVQRFARPEHQRVLPEPQAPLSLLAAGPGWLAVDKAAGAPVHPLDPDETGTVLNAVVARHPEIQGVGESGLRSGVVHRLDVDTSGALLFATEEQRWRELRAAFSEHRVTKVYRALVRGRLEGDGAIELAFVTARHRPARVRVVDGGERTRGARAGSLSWRCLERFDEASYVEVRPRTGHLHQIRATFEYLGHPLLGDRVYGGTADDAVSRHMLHAHHVAVGDIEATSPEPPDFASALARLRG